MKPRNSIFCVGSRTHFLWLATNPRFSNRKTSAVQSCHQDVVYVTYYSLTPIVSQRVLSPSCTQDRPKGIKALKLISPPLKLKFQVLSVILVDRDCEIGVLEVDFYHPIPSANFVLHHMNSFHFEVFCVHKFVYTFYVDYWPLATVFFGNQEHAGYEIS